MERDPELRSRRFVTRKDKSVIDKSIFELLTIRFGATKYRLPEGTSAREKVWQVY